MILTASDPVCNIKIRKRTALVKLKYRNKTYFFCSTSCKTAFKKAPKKYLPVAHSRERNGRPKKKKMKRGCCG